MPYRILFPVPMNDVFVSQGDTAVFQCRVHFRLQGNDPCGESNRFRWAHQGNYIYAADNDPVSIRNSVPMRAPNNFWFHENYEINALELRIGHVQKHQEGIVMCEVRWGPEPHHWLPQQAFLRVF